MNADLSPAPSSGAAISHGAAAPGGAGSTGRELMGLLPFVVPCLGMVFLEMPYDLSQAAGAIRLLPVTLFLVGYMVTLAALFYAWLKEFPRWSMPYLGYGVIFGLYMFFVATPGLAIFGVPIWGRQPWGWRACAPALLLMLLGFLFIRPPWKPLLSLNEHIRNDWTYLAFILYGFLPLVLLITQDEVANTFAFWPAVVAALIVLAGAVLHLLYAHKAYRAAFLFGGVFLSVLTASLSSNFYWKTHAVNMQTFEVSPLNGPVPWLPVVTGALTTAGIWTLLLALSMLAGLLHKGGRRSGGGAQGT